MSLNNNQMLPERIRNMRQMNDVINAEDIVLAEIEQIIDEMYRRTSMLHEELVNEAWLKSKLEERTGAEVEVTGYAEKLLVEIIFEISKIPYIDMFDVRKFLNKWLPAHLMYSMMILLSCCVSVKDGLQMEAFFIVRGDFYPRGNIAYLHLDGSWLLDGTYELNGSKADGEVDLYPATLGIATEVSAEPELEVRLTVERDLWYLDGAVILDGSRILDAEIINYKL